MSCHHSAQMFCAVPVHCLAAGGKQLLQSSRNMAGHQASTLAHLDCNLHLRDGARHMLLGKNGCGKSTMLRAINSGELEGWPKDVSTHLVDHDFSANMGLTALEAVLAADARTHTLLEEAAKLEEECGLIEDETALETVTARLCDIFTELEKRGADDESVRRTRACRILQGVGFEPGAVNSLVGDLSGGWQMRVALAAAFFAAPKLLLLDEPTNHLDLPTIEWLERYLTCEFRGTLLCVSHDRSFIDAVATELILFANGRLDYFSGTLANFEKQAWQRSKMLERQVDALERQKEHVMNSLKRIEEAADRRDSHHETNKENNRFGPLQGGGRANGAKKCSQVAQRKKKHDRMGLEKTADGKKFNAQKHGGTRIGSANANDGDWVDGKMTAAPLMQRGDPALKFGFLDPGPLGVAEDMPLLELCNVNFCYPGSDEAVLESVDFSVSSRSRIAVTGKNGAGKSTLIGLLVGCLRPTDGEVRRHPNLRVAHFSQHHAELVQERSATPQAYMQTCLPRMRDHELLAQLEAFGVPADMAARSMSSLSAGQRVRVAFARMCAEEPHVLVLDEPTNHLDIFSIDALADALQEFKGAVILVSHNKSLLGQVAEQVVAISDCAVKVDQTIDHAGLRFIPARAKS